MIRILLAIFLPPVAAFLTVGFRGHFWLNVLLSIIGIWITGSLHALWLVMKDAKGEL